MKKKNIRPAKRMAAMEKKPPVSVIMKQQSVLPLCVDAIAACLKKTSKLLPKISIDDSKYEDTSKLWLDADLFKEAIVDILINAIQHGVGRHGIVCRVSSEGMQHCRLTVSYTCQESEAGSHDDQFEISYYAHDRTREIVSQHRAAMNLLKDGRNVTIELCFP
jgi:K+-sensing histidine kinase KdpD